jgi:hypothetical protein
MKDAARGDLWQRDGFWSQSVHACAPLALWAAHFFGSYMFVAMGCRAGLDTPTVLGIPLLTLGLVALTVAALGWLALMLFGPTGTLRSPRRRDVGRTTDALPAETRFAGTLPADSVPEATLPEVSPGAFDGATAFRSGAAVLSLVAVAWTAVPMMLLHSCVQ